MYLKVQVFPSPIVNHDRGFWFKPREFREYNICFMTLIGNSGTSSLLNTGRLDHMGLRLTQLVAYLRRISGAGIVTCMLSYMGLNAS